MAGPLTWRNVDAPDMGSNVTALINANKNATEMISKALGGVGNSLDMYKNLNAEAADRAIAMRSLGIQDPAAYRQALMDGTLVGPDGKNVSTDMLANLDKRVGTLADQANKAEVADQLRYTNNRVRTGNELWDAAQADANLATREAAAGNRTRAEQIIANSASIAGLRQEQANDLLTDTSARGTNRISQDTSLQTLDERNYNQTEKEQFDTDQKAALNIFEELKGYAGTTSDMKTLYNGVLSDPKRTINARTAANLERLIKEGGFGAMTGPVTGGAGGSVSTPSGISGIDPALGTSFVDSIPFAETKDYVKKITSAAGEVTGTNLEKAKKLLPYLVQTESSGNPNAVSPKGAKGLTQVMPNTGKSPGYGVKPMKDDSPEEQLRFGKDYLVAMLDKHNGDVGKALASYNAGPGEVDKWLSKGNGVLSPSQNRNFAADQTNFAIGERASQNSIGGLPTEEYIASLNDTKSTPYDIAKVLATDEGSPFKGTDIPTLQTYISNAMERFGIGDNKVTPAIIGSLMRRNATKAEGLLQRGASQLVDTVGLLWGKEVSTPDLGNGMRINDSGFYEGLEQVRTGKLSEKVAASAVMGLNQEALTKARATYNKLDAEYQAVAVEAQSRPKLRASAENLKQKRDAAAAELARINAAIVGDSSLMPDMRRTEPSSSSTPTDEVERMKQYFGG